MQRLESAGGDLRSDGPGRTWLFQTIAAFFQNEKHRLRIGLLGALIPVLIYCAYVYRFSVDVPIADEYGCALGFLIKWKTAGSSAEQWKVLYQQHMEHRAVVLKLLYLASYYVCGNVNFVVVIFASTLAFIGAFAGLCWDLVRRHQLDPLFLPVLSCVTFNPVFHESMVFSDPCACYSFCLLFSYLGLRCALWPTRWLGPLLAALFAVLATYSFAVAIGLFGLFAVLSLWRRNWWGSAAWMVLGGVVAYAYVHGLKPIPDHVIPKDYSLGQWFRFFFTLAGVAFPIGPIPYRGLLGAALLLLGGWLIAWRPDWKKPFSTSELMILLLVGACGIIAYGRAGVGTIQATAPRYAHTLVILCVCVLGLLLARWRRQGFQGMTAQVLVLVLASSYCACVYSTYKPALKAWHRQARDSRAAWLGSDDSKYISPRKDHAKRLAQRAYNLDIYRPR